MRLPILLSTGLMCCLLLAACKNTQPTNKSNSLDTTFDYACCHDPYWDRPPYVLEEIDRYCAPDCDSCDATGTNSDNTWCGSFGDSSNWALGYPSNLCQTKSDSKSVYCASTVNGCSANLKDSNSCDKVCYSDCTRANTTTANAQVASVSVLNGVAYCNADPVMFCPSLVIDNSNGQYVSGTVTGCLCQADID